MSCHGCVSGSGGLLRCLPAVPGTGCELRRPIKAFGAVRAYGIWLEGCFGAVGMPPAYFRTHVPRRAQTRLSQNSLASYCLRCPTCIEGVRLLPAQVLAQLCSSSAFEI